MCRFACVPCCTQILCVWHFIFLEISKTCKTSLVSFCNGHFFCVKFGSVVRINFLCVLPKTTKNDEKNIINKKHLPKFTNKNIKQNNFVRGINFLSLNNICQTSSEFHVEFLWLLSGLLTNVWFISYSKRSNWCPILKLLSNFGCLFTFCYSAWAN